TTIESYRQLFCTLRTGPKDTVTSFEVVAMPMAREVVERAFATSKSMFESLQKRCETMAEKAPCWQVSILVKSNDADLAEKIRRLFLGQYESAIAQWQVVTHTAEEAKEQERFLGRPNILSGIELAPLAHFPASLEECGDL